MFTQQAKNFIRYQFQSYTSARLDKIEMNFFTVVALILIVVYFANRYFLRNWNRQGIPQGDPKALFGDFKDAFMHKKSIADVVKKIYMESKQHGVFGVYLSYRPMLFINDPKIIHNIMLKDFNYFPDRGLHCNGQFDPLTEQIFFQGGEKWKKLRTKLTPAFTSGKLKAMLPIVSKNGEILKVFMKKVIRSGSDVFEFRDLIARLNTNIITSVAFGIEVDTINDRNHIMRHVGVKVFEPNLRAGLRFFTSFFMPKLNDLFKFKFVDDEIEIFFTSIIKENIQFREENDYNRSDLMQTLIQLKNEGFEEGNERTSKLTVSDICGQSFGFYLGGEVLVLPLLKIKTYFNF